MLRICWPYVFFTLIVSTYSFGNDSEHSCAQTFRKSLRLAKSTEEKHQTFSLETTLSSSAQAVQLARQLREQTPNNKRHPLKISARTHAGSSINLPTNIKEYSQTYFVRRSSPQTVLEHQEVLGPVEIGYPSDEGFKKVGEIQYVLIEKGHNGKIIEVGSESELALREFKNHLFGRKLSAKESKTIKEINTRLLADLRQNPKLLAKVNEFSKKRNWPDGITEKSGIAFVDNDAFPILEWARKNGYTYSEMKDAGWLSLRFSRTGKPYYVVNQQRSIKIPYFTDPEHNEVAIWRTRQVDQTDPLAPKYLSWPMDRSIERESSEFEQLYNSPELRNAAGKKIIITEGEFKALVVQQLVGEITLGLRGITEFSATIQKALIKAKPEEVIIILDRDPKASSLMRTDGVSDSQRAAYHIAKQLQDAGLKTRVGILPDAFGGAKVGMDDLVLAQGPAPLRLVIDEATSPEEYASKLGLDPKFQELTHRRQILKRAVSDYKTARARMGSVASGALLENAQKLIKNLDATFKTYLSKMHNSYSLNQASSKYSSLSRVPQIPDAAQKKIHDFNGNPIPVEFFTDEILLLDFTPKNDQVKACKPVPCISFAYSQGQIRDTLRTNDRTSELGKSLDRGLAIADKTGFVPKEIKDYNTLILAAHLSENFPIDDYQYDFDVSYGTHYSKEPSTRIPLVIRKHKSGKVVGVAQLRFNGSENTQTQFQRLVQFLR